MDVQKHFVVPYPRDRSWWSNASTADDGEENSVSVTSVSSSGSSGGLKRPREESFASLSTLLDREAEAYSRAVKRCKENIVVQGDCHIWRGSLRRCKSGKRIIEYPVIKVGGVRYNPRFIAAVETGILERDDAVNCVKTTCGSSLCISPAHLDIRAPGDHDEEGAPARKRARLASTEEFPS